MDVSSLVDSPIITSLLKFLLMTTVNFLLMLQITHERPGITTFLSSTLKNGVRNESSSMKSTFSSPLQRFATVTNRSPFGACCWRLRTPFRELNDFGGGSFNASVKKSWKNAQPSSSGGGVKPKCTILPCSILVAYAQTRSSASVAMTSDPSGMFLNANAKSTESRT